MNAMYAGKDVEIATINLTLTIGTQMYQLSK